MKKICSVEDCQKPRDSKGLCKNHYMRGLRRGEIETRPDPGYSDRFWAKVEKTESCWNWTAAKTHNGYGVAYLPNHKQQVAHKIAYRMLVGEVPDGIELDHTCHNRSCVNPDHLRQATHKQNQENRTGAQSNSKSGVRGVHYNRRTSSWVATVKHERKMRFSKQFKTLEEAAAAVQAARNEIFSHNDLDRVA